MESYGISSCHEFTHWLLATRCDPEETRPVFNTPTATLHCRRPHWNHQGHRVTRGAAWGAGGARVAVRERFSPNSERMARWKKFIILCDDLLFHLIYLGVYIRVYDIIRVMQ